MTDMDDDNTPNLLSSNAASNPSPDPHPQPEDIGTPDEAPDVEELLALLRADEVPQRIVAVRAFCEIQESRAVPYLIRFLQDSCPLIRVSAAYAIGRNPSPDGVEPLIQQYHQDWNGYVRKGVVWALGNCRDARALPPLLEALQTDISAVRLWAASSLGQMSTVNSAVAAQAIPAVLHALNHDLLPAVRSNCAWALGQLCQTVAMDGDYRQAIAALITALSDPDLGVQEDARAALLKLGDPTGLQAIEDLEAEGLL